MKFREKFIQLNKALKFVSPLISLCINLSCYSDTTANIGNYQKGMSLPSWEQNEYIDERVLESLTELKIIGADYIAVTPTWFQTTKYSNKIYPTEKTPTDSAVRYVIDLAHILCFKVMLKPHLDVEDGSSRIEISPTSIDDWASAYRKFINHYAVIARATKVDEFCIGTELKGLSGSPIWQEIIDSIKAIYTGPLTYAANWNEYPNVNFWSKLDYIGIDAYFPIAVSREATVEEYLDNLRLWIEQIDHFQGVVNKKIIITEVGFRSIKGSGVNPWDWQYSGIMDVRSQADAYRIVLQTLPTKDWLAGIFFWYWPCLLDYDITGYSPYNKEAEEILRTFWQ